MDEAKIIQQIFLMAANDGAEITDPGSTQKQFTEKVGKLLGADAKKLCQQMFRDGELRATDMGVHYTIKFVDHQHRVEAKSDNPLNSCPKCGKFLYACSCNADKNGEKT
jgi:hypothetical protein